MPVNEGPSLRAYIGKKLRTNTLAKIAEIVLVFACAYAIIQLLNPIARDSLVLKQAVAWLANITMLFIIWTGLKLRGEHWSHFGLSTKSISWKAAWRVVLLSGQGCTICTFCTVVCPSSSI